MQRFGDTGTVDHVGGVPKATVKFLNSKRAGSVPLPPKEAEGKDLYCEIAQKIFNKPVNKKDNVHERSVGKAAALALGYNG